MLAQIAFTLSGQLLEYVDEYALILIAHVTACGTACERGTLPRSARRLIGRNRSPVRSTWGGRGHVQFSRR